MAAKKLTYRWLLLDRFKNRTAFSRPRLRPACGHRAFIGAASVSTLVACGSAADPGSDAASEMTRSGIAAWVADAGPWRSQTINWPRDFAEHPGAPTEAREWFIALVDTDDASVHGIVQRIARVQIASTPAASGSSASAWALRAVAQSAGHWESDTAPKQTWAETERVAVGLAGYRSNEGGATLSRFETHVLGHSATFEPQSRSAHDHCSGLWTLTLPSVSARITQTRCPRVQHASTRTIAWSQPMVTEAIIMKDGDTRSLSGVAWMRHAWGGVPEVGSAVRLNTAVLTLAGLGTLEVTQTSRASGRGPRITTVRPLRLSASAEAFGTDDAEWTPADRSHALGERSTLVVSSLGLDLTLKPMSDEAATADIDGRLRRTVVVSGSHLGAGYIDVDSADPVGAQQ